MSPAKKAGNRKTLSSTDQAVDRMLRAHGTSLSKLQKEGVENTRQLIYNKYLECANLELEKLDERIKLLESKGFVQVPVKAYMRRLSDDEIRGGSKS